MNHPLAAVPEGITADVLLDTDIGSDVDDALALGVLLGSPEARITGVTTVYGDTLLRARLTHRLGALAGRDLTVVPGAKDTLSGKDVWWAGHEGKAFTDLEREPVREDTAADRFLVDSVLARPGEIDVIGIAPLANIARAIRLDDRFAAGVRGLYLMGGSFGPDARPEHNIVSDITAARVVFGSGIRTVVTGLEITTRLRIESAGIETIRGSRRVRRSARPRDRRLDGLHRRAVERSARPDHRTLPAAPGPVHHRARHGGDHRRRPDRLHRRPERQRRPRGRRRRRGNRRGDRRPDRPGLRSPRLSTVFAHTRCANTGAPDPNRRVRGTATIRRRGCRRARRERSCPAGGPAASDLGQSYLRSSAGPGERFVRSALPEGRAGCGLQRSAAHGCCGYTRLRAFGRPVPSRGSACWRPSTPRRIRLVQR